MIHNTFTLIGYVISDFTKKSENKGYRIYSFTLEIERLNGKTTPLTIDYLEDIFSQTKLDRNKIVGSQIAVTGYILASPSKGIHLLAQEIYMLDKRPFTKTSSIAETIMVEDLFE